MTKTAKPTQEALVQREQAIAERMRALPIENVLAAIAADRQARWKSIVAAMTVPTELAEWARQMTDLQGPLVRIHRNTVDWPTALLIARYGEAEHFWPDAFEDDDIRRAWKWLAGDRPEGVQYITVEG